MGAELLADADGLRASLAADPSLASARPDGCRTLLHMVVDWPGGRPNRLELIRALVEAGADVNAPFANGPHTETALHWAASSDDVEAFDLLLDLGADIEARGGVIGGGTALDDAWAFGQWRAARRLVERGARPTLPAAAALGLPLTADGKSRTRSGRRAMAGSVALPRRCWRGAPILRGWGGTG